MSDKKIPDDCKLCPLCKDGAPPILATGGGCYQCLGKGYVPQSALTGDRNWHDPKDWRKEK